RNSPPFPTRRSSDLSGADRERGGCHRDVIRSLPQIVSVVVTEGIPEAVQLSADRFDILLGCLSAVLGILHELRPCCWRVAEPGQVEGHGSFSFNSIPLAIKIVPDRQIEGETRPARSTWRCRSPPKSTLLLRFIDSPARRFTCSSFRQRRCPRAMSRLPFIPAHAGLQSNKRRRSRPWIPAFAGMSGIDVDSIPPEHALAHR